MSLSHVSPYWRQVPLFAALTQPAARSSSAFIRSLPQPPHNVSPLTTHGIAAGQPAGAASLLLVPPTSQSLPRSPKIESLPSLFRVSNGLLHVPFGSNDTQPGGVVRPSVRSKLRKYWPLTGGAPPVSVHVWPLLDTPRQCQTEPSAKKRIVRRGSYSS